MNNSVKRLESVKYHLGTSENPHFETLRIHRKPGQSPSTTKLDPIRFLLRSAMIYPYKKAIIHRERTFTYSELADRVKALANVLIEDYNVKNGDRVGILCQNTNVFAEAQYAIPAIGAITVPINTRLAPKEIEYIIEHSGATLLIVQQELLSQVTDKVKSLVTIIETADSDNPDVDPYEKLLGMSSNRLSWSDLPSSPDENDTISINYTSGSTGKPKGVMITYRGAYINALGTIFHDKLGPESVYLWTLPMFHCNGWGFCWAILAAGGTQVMLGKLDYTLIWKLLKEHGVTHYNGAPVVQNEICNHKNAIRLDHPVYVYSGGSALPSALIKRMRSLNLIPTQAYGLTETYGTVVISYDQYTLSEYDEDEQCKLLARPGYGVLGVDEVRVINSKTGLDVKPDGKEIGEVCITGNLVMKGYYKNPEETEKAFKNGVFWTGDLAVRHSDGAFEIMDRSKDIIISGGENISSIEVEGVIAELDEVMECAVVAMPNDKWGERPVAFVVLKENQFLLAQDIIDHCRSSLAGYKCPSKIIFTELIPKTSTGKTQKFKLRENLSKKAKKEVIVESKL